MIRAAIFDVDGTLVDTKEAVFLLMNETLLHFGLAAITFEEYSPLFGLGAYGMSEGVLRISAGQAHGLEVEEFVAEMSRRYLIEPLKNTRHFSGVPQLLHSLRDKGIVLAALSNKPEEINRKIIQGMFPAEIFAHSMGHRPGFALKPDPGMLRLLCGRLGVLPESCLLIGDTPIDMQTAKNAGAMAVGVLWSGGYDAAALRAAGADYIAATPEEILTLF